MLLKQSLCISREFEQPHTFFKVGLIGGLKPLDFSQAAILLGAPLTRHSIVKCGIHLSVELVDVHGVNAALKPVVFGPQPANSGFVLTLFVVMAGPKRFPHPSKDLVVESQPTKQLRELRLDDLLANVRFPAPALVSCAMVVDVALLFDFADHRTPAVAASD